MNNLRPCIHDVGMASSGDKQLWPRWRRVVQQHPGMVMMRTRVGGTRVVDMLSGEQLPRIC